MIRTVHQVEMHRTIVPRMKEGLAVVQGGQANHLFVRPVTG